MSIKQKIKSLFIKNKDYDHAFKRGILKGLNFRINPMHKLQRIFGLDEREIEHVTRKYGAIAKSAIDVGANDGWYSVFFASLPNIEKVTAIEPDSTCNENLAHNLEINNINKAKVRIVSKFVSSQNDDKCVTIDSMAAGMPEPLIIKIDVDGAELDVLKGATETLKQNKVLIILETHSFELEKQCSELLVSFGYKVTIRKNAWYRIIIKDERPLAHNRWLYAEK